MRLKDKVALITGAGTGIGEASAHKFALPYLRKSRGNIICAGSEAGFNGSPGFTPAP